MQYTMYAFLLYIILVINIVKLNGVREWERERGKNVTDVKEVNKNGHEISVNMKLFIFMQRQCLQQIELIWYAVTPISPSLQLFILRC